jgi:hypothetical protein
MCSQFVFEATTKVINRYLLSRLTSKATRRLHRPNTRIQDTTNDALIRLTVPEPIPSQLIDGPPQRIPSL